MGKPKIGDVVLFKIDPSDFGIVRPLLVTHVNDDGSIEGEVFFVWELDRHREWPTKHLFYRLAKDQRTVQVVGMKQGEGVGEWQFRAQEPSAALQELQGKFDELVKGMERGQAARQPPRPLIPEKRGRG